MKNGKYILLLALLSYLFSACTEEVGKRFFQEDELSIAAYLEENKDDYSLFIELLDHSGYKQAFNAYGSYTLFVFKDDAFRAYLEANGYSSVTDMPIDKARILVKYHTLKSTVTSGNLGYGKLPARNLEDDELVSSFAETGLQGIILNRESTITERDIQLSNGVLHVLDKTMTPLIMSLMQKMESTGEFDIFVDAAKLTGHYALLNRTYDTISETEIVRQYFTIFAETDDIFNQQGIFSVDDLVQKYNNGVGNPSSPSDSLNKFIANHFIYEKALFAKDFITSNYQSYSGDLINFIVDQSFIINLQGPDDNQTFLTFLNQGTDFQAKNGVYHKVNNVLDIFFPEPVEVIWDFLDQPYARDLVKLGKRDTPVEPTLLNFPNMTGTISGIQGHYPWECYNYYNCDCLTLVAPSFDFTVHMPVKIVKGRYKLYIGTKNGSGRATIQILINGIPVGEPVNMNGHPSGAWIAEELFVSEVNLTETAENDVRFVTVVNGFGPMDYLRFEPL